MNDPNSMARVVAEAHAAWPGFDIDEQVFVSWVTERMRGDVDTSVALADLRIPDLYLACACAHGHATALQRFEDTYLSGLPAALSRMQLRPEVLDEVIQRVRHKLLVSEGSAAPRIALFTGRTDLGAWLHVTAVRTALDLLRTGKREVAVEHDVLDALVAASGDPELAHLKHMYRTEFRKALAAGIERLSVRERNLLRYSVIEDLNIDHIGRIYRVHRATAARWLARARAALLAHTRKELMQTLGVGRGEFESIMRLIQSQLDFSLGGDLVSAAEDD